MGASRYVFRSTWRLAATPADVYDTLVELGEYPAWWPEVRSVTQIAEDVGEVRCRSVLPYELVFRTRRQRTDPAAGVLEARLEGDLDGVTRWTIRGLEAWTAAVFEEDVALTRPVLWALAPVAGPAFRMNHWLMMRSGARGLRRRLEPG